MSLNTTPTDPAANSYVTAAEADAYFANRVDVSDWTALTNDQKEAILKQAALQIDSLRFFHEPVIERAMWYRLKQIMQFPRSCSASVTGKAQSGTTTKIVDIALANMPNYPTDFWKNGCVIITEGTNRGQTRKISAFNATTGEITVDTAFTAAIDDTSYFRLIEQVPQPIKDAQCEQALYIVKGGGDRARMRSEGVQSYQIGDVSENFTPMSGEVSNAPICAEAKGFLRGFHSRVGRFV